MKDIHVNITCDRSLLTSSYNLIIHHMNTTSQLWWIDLDRMFAGYASSKITNFGHVFLISSQVEKVPAVTILPLKIVLHKCSSFKGVTRAISLIFITFRNILENLLHHLVDGIQASPDQQKNCQTENKTHELLHSFIFNAGKFLLISCPYFTYPCPLQKVLLG